MKQSSRIISLKKFQSLSKITVSVRRPAVGCNEFLKLLMFSLTHNLDYSSLVNSTNYMAARIISYFLSLKLEPVCKFFQVYRPTVNAPFYVAGSRKEGICEALNKDLYGL